MSTTATFEDDSSFQEASGSVRNDSADAKYVIVGHVNDDPLRIQVVKTGQDVEELADEMQDDQVMYVLARYQSTFDMSDTVKFVYFRWIGDKVPFTKKGKFGVVHGSIQQWFNPYHAFIETSSREDFYTKKVMQQLEETTGMKSKVLESGEGRQMRGFTATQLPKRGPQAKSGPQISSEGALVEISQEVYDAILAVRSDDDSTQWMVAEYRDGSPKGPIDLTGTGKGDSSELASNLVSDKPMYGLYRVTDKVDDITTVKFVYIIWVGQSVKPMTKAKISTHKGTAEQTFGPFHVSIYANDQSDISESIIMEKVTSASGTRSHVK